MRLPSEAEFSRWLRDRMPGHVQRIESQVGNGIPDINWCWQGNHMWIETKLFVRGRVLLRKEQYAWGMRRQKCGGLSLVVALDPVTMIVATWMFPLKVVKCGEYLAIAEDPDIMEPQSRVDDFTVYIKDYLH